jgi:hypothetical protein
VGAHALFVDVVDVGVREVGLGWVGTSNEETILPSNVAALLDCAFAVT